MPRYELLKNQTIIVLFSLSIFFSFIIISNATIENKIIYSFSKNFNSIGIQFRFLYLLTFLFIIYDCIVSKKINKKVFVFSILISFIIFIYSFIVFIFKFSDLLDFVDFFKIIKQEETFKFIIKVFTQSIVIGLSILIIYFYKNFLIQNLSKIIDFYVCILVTLIILFEIFHFGILFDTLFRCDLGFFYHTKYLYKENSHFAILSAPILTFFIYNIKDYLKKKIFLIFYLVFLFFCFGNFSLTFFLSIISSTIIIFIICRNISKISKYLFLILMITSCAFFFSERAKNNCVSKATYISEKYGFKPNDIFLGSIQTPKKKISSFLDKDNSNLSVSVFIYSYYVAKKSLFENPLGVGINNYKNYRKVTDNTLDIDWNTKYGTIKFKEKYMPNMNSFILNFNLNSGSTNFSKLVTEFGFISILILLLIFIFSFSNKLDDNIKVFFIPLIFIQIFFRGTGYFNSGFLISLIIILMIILNLLIQKYENNNSTKL